MTQLTDYDYQEIDGETIAILKPESKDAYEKRNLEVKYKKAGIPVDYWDLGFKDAIVGSNKDVVSICRSYYQDVQNGARGNLYLFSSDNGTGKSTAACAIGKDFIKAGKRVKFVLADHLIDLLMKTAGYSYIEELEKEKASYQKCDLIIIDDAFDEDKALTWKSSSNSQILSRWDSFLRDVIQNNVRIIVTSNIRFEKIKTLYTKSIYALLERNFKVLEFTEKKIKDLRKERIDIAELSNGENP